MDIKINLETLKDLENENIKIDVIKFQKMLLLFNSIDLYIGSNPINQLTPDYINIFGELKYQNTELYNNIIVSKFIS